jgi:hypothetical protein
MGSTSINFITVPFTATTPTFDIGAQYPTSNGYRFANKSYVLSGIPTTLSYVAVTLNWEYNNRPTDSIDYLSVTFSHPSGQPVSVQTSQNGLYVFSFQNTGFKLFKVVDGASKNNNITFYVVCNAGGIPTDLLNITVSCGDFNPPVDVTVNLSWVCGNPIYEYQTGLHVYSPYDAVPSRSKLRTKLYSLTPIEQWNTNTIVYSSPFLNNPALPYFYGYGDKVYQVGNGFDRGYGTKKQYRVKKKRFKKNPKVTEETLGPQNWYDYTNELLPNCIKPTLGGVGRIRQIYLNSTLTQPQKYRYYLGYESNLNQGQKSNDNFFTWWSWSKLINYPILGTNWFLNSTVGGVIEGWDASLNGSDYAVGPSAGLLGLGSALVVGGSIATGVALSLALPFELAIVQCLGPTLIGSVSTGPPGWIVGAIILVIVGLILLFSAFEKYEKLVEQTCVNLLGHFTTTPYIESGNPLYRNVNMTQVNTGYYCDGMYFYIQRNGIIDSKFVSSCDELIDDDPVTTQFNYAILADNPDDLTSAPPFLVQNWTKLLLLPLTSGKPIPFCGEGRPIYYNDRVCKIVGVGGGCDMEATQEINVCVEAGTYYSCVSKSEADIQAAQQLDYLISYTESHYIPQSIGSQFIGELDLIFTHELKVEQNPMELTLNYDKRISQTPIVGMSFYYDSLGCEKPLTGYYALTGTTPYRTFYHVDDNGTIDGIYTMQNSNSTTTTTGEPIITTNTDYTSNWYLTDLQQSNLDYYYNYISNLPQFDQNLLLLSYTVGTPPNPQGLTYTYVLKKGFIKTPTTRQSFYLYNDFTTTSYSAAPYGWYRPLIDYEGDSFLYS